MPIKKVLQTQDGQRQKLLLTSVDYPKPFKRKVTN